MFLYVWLLCVEEYFYLLFLLLVIGLVWLCLGCVMVVRVVVVVIGGIVLCSVLWWYDIVL